MMVENEWGVCDLAVPLISVAMPVYNGGIYLSKAIDSILSQSFSNFELIIINDGSTDDSLVVLQGYEKRDRRIRLISRENRNLVSTLNEIVDLARGKWIARMDQDDISLPNRFERQLAWLEQTGADICGSWAKLFGTRDTRILKHAQTDAAIKVEMLFGTPFAHPTVMMKTEYVKQLRYDKAWEKCEDYDLWERAACAGWKMGNVPEVLLLYRQHGEQVSSKAFDLQQSLTQIIRRRYWLSFVYSSGLSVEYIDAVLRLREPVVAEVNVDYIDSVLICLLKKTEGESRAVVFDNLTKLYYRIASNCPSAGFRWLSLNRKYGLTSGFAVGFKLFLLSVFRLGPGNKRFDFLKRVYFYLSRLS